MKTAARTRSTSSGQADKADDLKRFARTIHPILRKNFATRRLRRLLLPIKSRNELRQVVPLWVPAKASIVVAIAAGFAAYWLVQNHTPPGVATLIPTELSSVPYISYWPLLLGLVVGWLFETSLLPRWFFLGYRFRLMRLEADQGEGDHPCVYTSAGWKNSATGFSNENWSRARGVEVGDLIVSIRDRKGVGRAMILLRTKGPLPAIAWHRDLYQEGVFPALPPSVEELARRFDEACDQHYAVAQIVERGRALRSSKVEPTTTAPGDELPDVDQVWSGIAVPEQVKERLISAAISFADGSKAATRGLLLYGPPGTGKTLIAKALADTVGCPFYPLTMADLKADVIGGSAERVRQVWQKALSQPRAVIFVDECDGVFGRRGGLKSDQFVEEIVGAFLPMWDGFTKQTHVWVVGATNRRELIDPAILQRFEEEVEIGLPSEAQRAQILGRELQRLGCSSALPAQLAKLTQGMSGRELAGMAKRIVREHGPGVTLSDQLISGYARSFRRQGSTTVDSGATWDRLVLAQATLDRLKKTVALLRGAETFARQGISVPKGMLLYGPPGTGKTQIARTLANESGLRFIAASSADIKQGWLGQSGQALRQLFEQARESSPSLLFIDEIDIVARARGGHHDSIVNEIVGQLLQEMDGVKQQESHVFVLAATNCPDQIDSAVLSRFPERIEIPLPDEDGIRRLLAVLLGPPKSLELPAEEFVAFLVQEVMGQGKSGRDLHEWVKRAEQNAALRALEEGHPERVVIALSDFGIQAVPVRERGSELAVDS